MDTQALIVEGLRKHYGELRAADGVSFAVAKGEVFGILGPNGAGKTTTIECIEGLRQPDAGEITVLGVTRGAERPAIRQRLGIQLQTTGLYPKLSVREVLELFAAFYDRALPIAKAVELVGLTEVAYVPTSKLSGG
ncbi:MAG: ATP-binding cassette domain-containing protein [Anaerolineae bacterium]